MNLDVLRLEAGRACRVWGTACLSFDDYLGIGYVAVAEAGEAEAPAGHQRLTMRRAIWRACIAEKKTLGVMLVGGGVVRNAFLEPPPPSRHKGRPRGCAPSRLRVVNKYGRRWRLQVERDLECVGVAKKPCEEELTLGHHVKCCGDYMACQWLRCVEFSLRQPGLDSVSLVFVCRHCLAVKQRSE